MRFAFHAKKCGQTYKQNLFYRTREQNIALKNSTKPSDKLNTFADRLNSLFLGKEF